MKKNLVKLALSGAALAAVAATLGTSTYAWYTTNPTVSANNIVGASSDTGSTSIFINKDHLVNNKLANGNNPVWSSTVTFDGTEFNLSTGKLIPVQPTATMGTFQTVKPTKGANDAVTLTPTDATANDVITFELNFKGSKLPSTAAEIKVYIKGITITNTTSTNLPEADNLTYGLGLTDVGVASTAGVYSVDFVKALGMQVNTGVAANNQTFALSSYQAQTGNTAAKSGVPTATGAAHAYYNAVMDTDFTGDMIDDGQELTAASYDATKPIATLNRDGVTASTVTFTVFLNGWSDYCYDACAGQNFKINMSFTSETPTGA